MKKIFTIPNIISLFRIALLPFFAYFYLVHHETHSLLAFLLIILSALSDVADGFIARKFNMISDVGKVLDPLADKLTQVVIAVCMLGYHKTLMPVLIVLATKELLTAVAAVFWFKSGKPAFSSRWWGKVSTLLLYASFFYYGLCDIWKQLSVYAVDISFMIITIAFMLFSMCSYIKYFLFDTSETLNQGE